jgi:hypothetical protein
VANRSADLRVCRILVKMADALFSSSWRILMGFDQRAVDGFGPVIERS